MLLDIFFSNTNSLQSRVWRCDFSNYTNGSPAAQNLAKIYLEICQELENSAIFDDHDDLVATLDGFADAVVEGVECGLGMDEGAKAIEAAYEDAAVEAVVDAVAGLDLWTPARQGAVSVHERQLLAVVTRWSRNEARHLAGILLAADEGDLIVA